MNMFLSFFSKRVSCSLSFFFRFFESNLFFDLMSQRSGQIIATSYDLTSKGSFSEGKKSLYFRKIQVGEI